MEAQYGGYMYLEITIDSCGKRLGACANDITMDIERVASTDDSQIRVLACLQKPGVEVSILHYMCEMR